MTATTAILVHRKRVIRRFKDVGATAPQRAIDPATHHIRQSLIFNELLKDKVLVKVNACHYYLDESREADYNRQQMQWVGVLIMLFFLGAIMFMLTEWQ